MHWHAKLVVATLLVARCLITPTVAAAQHAAYASISPDAAQALATHAIECLRRGEDGLARQSRLAAYREGIELAKRAVAADDRNADAHFALFANNGRVLQLEGGTPNPFNFLELGRELDRALQLDPNHSDALAAKGGLYRQLPWLLGGSSEKAEGYLTRSIEINPNAVSARIELAATYRDMGEPERGVPLLDKAIQVAEHDGKYRQLAEARALWRELKPQP
jgi:tetratricopeptide (TPR) repeat protein